MECENGSMKKEGKEMREKGREGEMNEREGKEIGNIDEKEKYQERTGKVGKRKRSRE